MDTLCKEVRGGQNNPRKHFVGPLVGVLVSLLVVLLPHMFVCQKTKRRQVKDTGKKRWRGGFSGMLKETK
jgi:hypothetical protein